MVDKKESGGLWKNYVISALAIALAVVLFYSPGVLLSPADDCRNARILAQAAVDAAQANLDAKNAELADYQDRLLNAQNALDVANARKVDITDNLLPPILRIPFQVARKLRANLITEEQALEQIEAAYAQRLIFKNELSGLDTTIGAATRAITTLTRQVADKQAAVDAAQANLEVKQFNLDNLPVCPSEPSYVPAEPDTPTETP